MIYPNLQSIEKLRSSIDSFGFGLLTDAIAPSLLERLQNEATERSKGATFAEQSSGLAYRASITSLGPCARDFLGNPKMTDFLTSIFGGRFVLTEHRSCLTFYKTGDHLGPHLDKPAEECMVTIIVYLIARGPVRDSDQTGLQLRVYGEELTENPQAILTIPTTTGAIVLGRGSRIWHGRPSLQEGEFVAALTGCYGNASASDCGLCDTSLESGVPGESGTAAMPMVGGVR